MKLSAKSILVSISILALSIAFISCGNDLKEVEKLQTKDLVDVEIAKDFQMLYSDSAMLKVKISGPTLKRYLSEKDPKEEFPDGIHVEFYNERLQVTSVLTAKYAIRRERKGNIIVEDSVVWESISKERLESEELIWDEKEGKVYTNKFVTLKRPDEIIYGHGFEAEQDFSKSRIKAITGQIKVDLSDEFD